MEKNLEAISMEPVKEKLRNLSEYFPNTYDFISDFGKYLADRLNPKLLPEGFNLTYEIVLEDLKRGGDYGESGRVEIPRNLTGHPPIMYDILRMKLPEIAKATCPSEFAERVIKFYGEVNVKIREDN